MLRYTVLRLLVFLGCLSPEGHLKWCSAGHGPMLCRKGMTGKFEVLEPTGPPIGVLPELNCDPTLETTLEPGGILIAMSDGIFESRSPDGDLFEVERVIALVEEDPNRTPQQIVTAIQQAMAKVVAEPQVRERVLAVGQEPVGNAPADFAAQFKADVARFAKVIEQARIPKLD